MIVRSGQTKLIRCQGRRWIVFNLKRSFSVGSRHQSSSCLVANCRRRLDERPIVDKCFQSSSFFFFVDFFFLKSNCFWVFFFALTFFFWKKNSNKRHNSFYLMIFGYSLSLPWESRHLRYMTDASTLAGEYVFGSFSREITDNKIVRTFCVGFHRSHGNSPLCGSSTGGCNIEIHRSPFCNSKEQEKINAKKKPRRERRQFIFEKIYIWYKRIINHLEYTRIGWCDLETLAGPKIRIKNH